MEEGGGESTTVEGVKFNVHGGDSWVDIGGKKRLTVRKFKGNWYVDFREVSI